MSKYKYSKIVSKAQECKDTVKKEYRLGISKKWCYYIAKSILKPKTDIAKIDFEKEATPQGTHISRQLRKEDYVDLAKRLTNYVEKHHRLPNYVTYKDYKIKIKLLTYVFAKVILHYHKDGKLPSEITINSKIFTKPTETGNVVFDYFVKKTGFKPKTLDDVCNWVLKYVKYLFYFDDQKSNLEVIDSKSGNCTDLLQFLCNMAEALGYDWEVIHTKCRQSGTGHVYGRFKKKGTNNWFTRDIACIADESRYCVWCEVPNGGNLLAKNPSWFLENLRR